MDSELASNLESDLYYLFMAVDHKMLKVSNLTGSNLAFRRSFAVELDPKSKEGMKRCISQELISSASLKICV